MDFSLHELTELVKFDGTELHGISPVPNSVIWVWRDSKSGQEVARLWIIFEDRRWRFEVLVVSETRKGFMGKLAYALGNFAVENNIDSFYISLPVIQSRSAFLHIGFSGESTDLECNPMRVAEYGNWRMGESEEPEWHKRL